MLLYLIEILHQTTTESHSQFAASSLYLIEILHQTTTFTGELFPTIKLYLIEILHQTTTTAPTVTACPQLYLIEILHQTTTENCKTMHVICCILSKFYIKPQLMLLWICFWYCCILSKFYIKPQLLFRFGGVVDSCILSKFYIKPQLEDLPAYVSRVVSYRNSTSNHNCNADSYLAYWLYLIEILHQTTTRGWSA